MNNVKEKHQLDMEWINLIKEAKRVGLSKKEVRSFLQEPREST